MLYRRIEIQDEILILCINTNVLYQEGTIFSDGNGSSNNTEFYYELEDLKYLDWNAILAKYWHNYDDGKRKSCAEVLVPVSIPFSSVEKIICRNWDYGNAIRKILGLNEPIKLSDLSTMLSAIKMVEVDSSLYF